MKHVRTITTSIPVKAESPAELAGMFSKLQTMAAATTAAIGTLTAGITYWNLIASPPNEIANGQKSA
jgi:hypothetical protein